jgi:hypothetical protein
MQLGRAFSTIPGHSPPAHPLMPYPAADHGIAQAWVGTEHAVGFYRRCGWALQETSTSSSVQEAVVLHKVLR